MQPAIRVADRYEISSSPDANSFQRFDHIIGARFEVMPSAVHFNLGAEHAFSAFRSVVMADADKTNFHDKPPTMWCGLHLLRVRMPDFGTSLTSINSACQAVSFLHNLALIRDAGQMAF